MERDSSPARMPRPLLALGRPPQATRTALSSHRREHPPTQACERGPEELLHRELSDDDLARVADTCHRWRGVGSAKYEGVAGLCKTVKTNEIASHHFVLTPERHVDPEEGEDDGEPFGEKLKRLVATPDEWPTEGERLEKETRRNLRGPGYGA